MQDGALALLVVGFRNVANNSWSELSAMTAEPLLMQGQPDEGYQAFGLEEQGLTGSLLMCVH
jgi:hypothetical protein